MVRAVVPENPRMDGAVARISSLEDWGAHVHTLSTASGRYRLAWHEMRKLDQVQAETRQLITTAKVEIMTAVYTGEICVRCGSGNVRRTGACGTCENCGETSSCG
jgi:hypothetical protein